MSGLLCPLPNWSFDDTKISLNTSYISLKKQYQIFQKCGKYPWYKFVYCTNNPKIMFRIYIHTRSPLRYQLSNDQLGKGHNSQLIVFTDYNLLLGVHWLQSSVQGRGTGRDLLHCTPWMDSQAVSAACCVCQLNNSLLWCSKLIHSSLRCVVDYVSLHHTKLLINPYGSFLHAYQGMH